MIFVTVGTHEQPFNRLIKEIDRLKKENYIEDQVIVQTGFGTYEPGSCQWKQFVSCQEMDQYMREARLVITHGGPASFTAPLRFGKIPIVVPRKKDFGEHVNDHQLEFCRMVKARINNIILVEDVSDLRKMITEYEEVVKLMVLKTSNNNTEFVKGIEVIVKTMGL